MKMFLFSFLSVSLFTGLVQASQLSCEQTVRMAAIKTAGGLAEKAVTLVELKTSPKLYANRLFTVTLNGKKSGWVTYLVTANVMPLSSCRVAAVTLESEE
jgi:hypothetical protein